MSLVTVHGPYTMYMTGGGGVTGSTPAGAKATVNPNNGLIWTFTCEGSRPSGELVWAFGAGASPATGNGVGPIVVTYGGAGTKAVTLTASGAGAPPPANGVYNMSVVATAGVLRSVNPEEGGEESLQGESNGTSTTQGTLTTEQPEVEVAYDPGAHTVNEVVDFAEDNPDQVRALLDAEQAGKNRSTLVSQLEDML